MPRFRSIGFMPETTYFMPSYTMDCVSTVAVVVPSPALSLVFDATSLTVCAPIFCSLFSVQFLLPLKRRPWSRSVRQSCVRASHSVLLARAYFNCIGQNIDAFDDFGAGLIAEYHFFCCHLVTP